MCVFSVVKVQRKKKEERNEAAETMGRKARM